MQIICKGKDEIAMTESELVDFFNVTDAGELEVFVNGRPRGYAPLYPLSSIIALSYQLDSTEAHLFRKYICQEIEHPTPR